MVNSFGVCDGAELLIIGAGVPEEEMNGPSSAPDDALARELGAMGLL
ncbi:hypothetical protein ACN6A1_16000 [Myxococcus virescens]